jgi:hypothetical protein
MKEGTNPHTLIKDFGLVGICATTLQQVRAKKETLI